MTDDPGVPIQPKTKFEPIKPAPPVTSMASCIWSLRDNSIGQRVSKQLQRDARELFASLAGAPRINNSLVHGAGTESLFKTHRLNGPMIPAPGSTRPWMGTAANGIQARLRKELSQKREIFDIVKRSA
jgi:hypothetical protein